MIRSISLKLQVKFASHSGEKRENADASAYSEFVAKQPLGVFVKALPLQFLFVLLFLASCGGQKTSVKLEVTGAALEMSNIGYQGGLVIMGKSSTGSFRVPIDYNASGSGSSVSLELPKGNWKFSAIGWAGTGKFSGTTTCDAVSVDIKDDVQSVNLSLTTVKCDTMESEFGDTTYYTSTSFRPFAISTCGWLYDGTSSNPVNNTTSGSYCTTGNDPEYSQHAQSAKVSVSQDIMGKVSPGLSACLNLVNGYLVSTLSLPTRGLPLEVTLFSSSNCTPASDEEIITTYSFPKGPATIEADQDSFLNNTSSNTNLFLVANETRRGYSGLFSALPIIQCNGLNCLRAPTGIPTAGDRIVAQNRDFIINDNPTSFQSCGTIVSVGESGISPGGVQSQVINNCYRTKDGKLASRFSFSSITSGYIQVFYADTSNMYVDLRTDPTYDIFARGFEVFGSQLTPPINSDVKNSFEILFKDKDKSFGILSNVREMMGPRGAAGVLGNISCSSDKVAEATFIDEGESKTYQIELAAGTATVTSNIADGTKVAGTVLPRKLVARKKISGAFSTVLIINFDCSYKIGIMETFEEKEDKIEKKRLEWNTQNPASAVAIEWKSEIEYVSAVIDNVRNSHTKLKNISANTAWAVTSSLEIKKNGGNYDYRSFKDQIYSDGTNDRVKYLNATGLASGILGTNDSTFASNLAINIASPLGTCTNLSSPAFTVVADTPCISVPATYQYTTFTDGDLLPTTFDAYFTPNFGAL